MSDHHIARRLKISGRVQGVGYRDWAIGTARALNIAGWVRNCSDGSVEALASGTPDAVAAFINACHRGPALARVTAITADDTEPLAQQSFEFRQTV